MRLTKSDKEAFVRSVMDDVPQIDYDEQARSLLTKWGQESIPESMRPFIATHPQYFYAVYIHTPAYLNSVHVIADPNWQDGGFKKQEPEKYAQLLELSELARAQALAHDDLRRKVSGIIATCSTLKTAEERLPEFKKYLPANRGGSGLANLPVANVLSELMNAGWPKGQEAAA